MFPILKWLSFYPYHPINIIPLFLVLYVIELWLIPLILKTFSAETLRGFLKFRPEILPPRSASPNALPAFPKLFISRGKPRCSTIFQLRAREEEQRSPHSFRGSLGRPSMCIHKCRVCSVIYCTARDVAQRETRRRRGDGGRANGPREEWPGASAVRNAVRFPLQVEEVFGSPDERNLAAAADPEPAGWVLHEAGDRDNGGIRLVLRSTRNNSDAQIGLGHGDVKGEWVSGVAPGPVRRGVSPAWMTTISGRRSRRRNIDEDAAPGGRRARAARRGRGEEKPPPCTRIQY